VGGKKSRCPRATQFNAQQRGERIVAPPLLFSLESEVMSTRELVCRQDDSMGVQTDSTKSGRKLERAVVERFLCDLQQPPALAMLMHFL